MVLVLSSAKGPDPPAVVLEALVAAVPTPAAALEAAKTIVAVNVAHDRL